MGMLLIMCLCFFVVWRRTIKRQQSQQKQLAFLTISHHMENQKGEMEETGRIEEKQAPARATEGIYDYW